MKHGLFFWLFVLVLFCSQKGQSQTWLWARSSGGGNNPAGTSVYQEGNAICTDHLGNVYISGDFYGKDITFGTFQLLSPKNGGIFLTKYDPNGQVIWAKAYGDSVQNANVTSVCTDSAGNVFLNGYFNGSAMVIGQTILYNSSFYYNAPFVVKSDPAGNVLWAKTSANIDGNVESQSISVDSVGNVYITGNFQGAFVTLGSSVLTNTGVSNIFLAKYDLKGQVIWAKSVSGTGKDFATSILTYKDGSFCMTGYFSSPVLIFGADTIRSTGTFTIFIAKYDAQGNAIWGKSIADYSDDEALALCSDSNKNLYITGYFSGTSLLVGSSTLINTGQRNTFVARYDPDGNAVWAQAAGIGTTASAQGYTLATDKQNNLYASGSFSGSSITFGSQNLPYKQGGEGNLYLVKYDSSGNVACASALAGGGDDGVAVCTDNFGHAYLVGDYYQRDLILGEDTLPLTTGNDGENIFVANYVCGCSSTAYIAGPGRVCLGQNTILSADGGRTYLWSTGATSLSIVVHPNTSTTYTVIAKYGSCSDTARKTVRVNPLPLISITAEQKIDYCEGGHNGSISVSTSSGTWPYIFSWSPTADSTESIAGLSMGHYTLFVTDSNGCHAQSKMVEISNPELFVPTYFSPNHNGMNEKECIYGKCILNLDFSIYDRWGEKVFETTNPDDCWDGNYRGMPMDTQVFVYTMTATLNTGKVVSQKGILNLVR
jgi:gliding motility-associated-like protein